MDAMLDNPGLPPPQPLAQPMAQQLAQQPALHTNIQLAPHALRQDRLVNNLCKDAADDDLPPMSSDVKDNGASVVLKCNPGFWIGAVKPTFASINDGYTRSVDNFTVSLCAAPTVLMDTNGISQQDQYTFSITPGNQPPKSVQVRFFNTNTSLQIHGGSPLPNGQTAAVWFAVRVFLPLCEARTKVTNFGEQAIKTIHSQILAAFSSATNPSLETASGSRQVCFECGRSFTLSSTNRLPCLDCGHYFHQNHMKTHSCLASSKLTGSRKRSRADTSGLASPPPPRAVRRRNLSDIDSDDSGPDDHDDAVPLRPDAQPSGQAALLPPQCPPQPSPVAAFSGGQHQLVQALHQSEPTRASLQLHHDDAVPPPPDAQPSCHAALPEPTRAIAVTAGIS